MSIQSLIHRAAFRFSPVLLVFAAMPAMAQFGYPYTYEMSAPSGVVRVLGDPTESEAMTLNKMQAYGPYWARLSYITTDASNYSIYWNKPFSKLGYITTYNGADYTSGSAVDSCTQALQANGYVVDSSTAGPNDSVTCVGHDPASQIGHNALAVADCGDHGTYFGYSAAGGTAATGQKIPPKTCFNNYAARVLETAQPARAFICMTCAGNPIDVGLGVKMQNERLFSTPGPSGLSVTMHYSTYRMSSPITTAGWTHNYQGKVIYYFNSVAQVMRGGKATIPFQLVYPTQTTFAPSPDVPAKLVRAVNGSGVTTGWTYTSLDNDDVEQYDAEGNLISITDRAGVTQTLSYDSQGRVSTVTNTFGKQITFAYDDPNNKVTVTDPAGNGYVLTYNAAGSLRYINYPDNKIREFKYDETGNNENGGSPVTGLLTGIVDENGARFATFKYNSTAQAISTEHAGSVEKYAVSFNADGSSTVVNPLTTSTGAQFVIKQHALQSAGRTQPCSTPSCTGTVSSPLVRDANANVLQRTDFNGNVTCYDYYSPSNLEYHRIEGLPAGTNCTTALAASSLAAPARKITTTWHATYRLPVTITEPAAGPSGGNIVTTNTYDSATGFLKQRDVATPADGTRTWLWTADAYGRVATATDPLGNVTTNAYYANTTAQGNNRGMLQSVTNAAGHATTMDCYNGNGQPGQITDANGLVTVLTYDARQRLHIRTVGVTGRSGCTGGTGGEVTTYDYYPTGLLQTVTMPDGSTLGYTYDDAHRLRQIQDGLGNIVSYPTLNNMGSREQEDAIAPPPSSVVARTHKRVYDALNRLKQDIGATNQPSAGADPCPANTECTQYGYDDNGNQVSVTAPKPDSLARTTTSEFDTLNRLKRVVAPVTTDEPTQTDTLYQYDLQDNLTQVTDPKGYATTYTFNGFNEVVTQASPDTGTTTFTYDAAGNLKTKTDARGKLATYGYDALNRVGTITYSDETVTYTYDTCTYGVGRLCSISDKTGTTAYTYDKWGRVATKSQTVSSLTQSVSYTYNAYGQMDTQTLPSGKVVTYSYTNNRITGISVSGVTILSGAVYEPFGPIRSWNWGNDSVASPNKFVRTYDQNGRNNLITSSSTVDPLQIAYDVASRITSLKRLVSGSVDTTKSVDYGYDNMDRLNLVTPESGNPASAQSFTYDGVGNRKANVIAGATTTYTYGSSTHRLSSLSGGTSKTFGYDNAGNVQSNGSQTWNYGDNNRPVSVTAGSTTILTSGINALGQRVIKTAGSTVTRFMYDEAGRLFGEYNGSGAVNQETVWLNDLPVAVLK